MDFYIKKDTFSEWQKTKNTLKNYLYIYTIKNKNKPKVFKSAFGFSKIENSVKNSWQGSISYITLDFDKIPLKEVKRIEKINNKIWLAKYKTTSGKGFRVILKLADPIFDIETYSVNYFIYGKLVSKIFKIDLKYLDKKHNLVHGNQLFYVGSETSSIFYNEDCKNIKRIPFNERNKKFQSWYLTEKQKNNKVKIRRNNYKNKKINYKKLAALINPKLNLIFTKFNIFKNLNFKTNSSGYIVSNLCPFDNLHSSNDLYKTSYWIDKYNKFHINCFHSTCQNSIEDLEKKVNKYIQSNKVFQNYDLYYKTFHNIFKLPENVINVKFRISEKTSEIIDQIKENKKCIISANTGSGKNYFTFKKLLNNFPDKKVILLAPLNAIVEQNFKDYSENAFLVNGDISYKEVLGTVNNPNIKFIISTYEGLRKILDSGIDLNDWFIIQDEIHSNLTATNYRSEANTYILKNRDKAFKFIGLTGTDFLIDDDIHKINIVREFNPFKGVKLNIIQGDNPFDIMVNNIIENKHKKNICLINSKAKIREIAEYLKLKGLKNIEILDSSLKEKSSEYKNIINNGELTCDILLTTQVIAEGINLKNKNFNILMLGSTNPHIQIQFINRFRNGTNEAINIIIGKQKTKKDKKGNIINDPYFDFFKECKQQKNKTDEISVNLNRLIESDSLLDYDENDQIELKETYLFSRNLLKINEYYETNYNLIKIKNFTTFWSKINKNPIFIIEFYKKQGINNFELIDNNIKDEDLKDFRKSFKDDEAFTEKKLIEKYIKDDYVEKDQKTLIKEREILRESYKFLYSNEKVEYNKQYIKEYIKKNSDIIYLKRFKKLMKLDNFFNPYEYEDLNNIIEKSNGSTQEINNTINRVKVFINSQNIKNNFYVSKDIAFLEYQTILKIKKQIENKKEIDLNKETSKFNGQKNTIKILPKKFAKIVRLFADVENKNNKFKIKLINNLKNLSDLISINNILVKQTIKNNLINYKE